MHPCDHPTYRAYRDALRVVFHTSWDNEVDEDAAVANMQRLKSIWMEATDA